jgi:hypothetical protein
MEEPVWKGDKDNENGGGGTTASGDELQWAHLAGPCTATVHDNGFCHGVTNREGRHGTGTTRPAPISACSRATVASTRPPEAWGGSDHLGSRDVKANSSETTKHHAGEGATHTSRQNQADLKKAGQVRSAAEEVQAPARAAAGAAAAAFPSEAAATVAVLGFVPAAPWPAAIAGRDSRSCTPKASTVCSSTSHRRFPCLPADWDVNVPWQGVRLGSPQWGHQPATRVNDMPV